MLDAESAGIIIRIFKVGVAAVSTACIDAAGRALTRLLHSSRLQIDANPHTDELDPPAGINWDTGCPRAG